MKWYDSSVRGGGHCTLLFSACQPDEREVEQVWRLERRRQIQTNGQIKEVGMEKW